MKNCSFASPQTESSAPPKDYTKDDNSNVCCNRCPKKFTLLRNFYRHNKDDHLNLKPKKAKKRHWCVVCSKIFEKQSNLLWHMQTHSKEIHTCDHCKKEYIRKDHYEAHLIVCTEENVVNSNAEGDISN